MSKSKNDFLNPSDSIEYKLRLDNDIYFSPKERRFLIDKIIDKVGFDNYENDAPEPNIGDLEAFEESLDQLDDDSLLAVAQEKGLFL